MRFLCEIGLNTDTIPKDYRRKVLSFFKSALTNYERKRFFDEFYGANGKKTFAFGVVLPKPVFQKDKILLAEKQIRLIFSTPSNCEGVVFFNSLLNQKGKAVPVGDDCMFILTGIRLLRENTVKSNAADFRIISPVCLRRHERAGNRDTYVSVASAEFVPVLKESLKEQLAVVKPGLVKMVDGLEVNTSMCKKTVVNHYEQWVEATIGTIGFCGEPILLEAINKMNLGCRKAAGFGLLQLLTQEEVNSQ